MPHAGRFSVPKRDAGEKGEGEGDTHTHTHTDLTERLHMHAVDVVLKLVM